ncbi:6155_t:CDS:1, partial [Diversispora eburnea]
VSNRVVKAVFSWSLVDTSTCQKPKARFKVKKKVKCPKVSSISAICDTE